MNSILYIILIFVLIIFILIVCPIKYSFLINTRDKNFYINVSYLFFMLNFDRKERYIKILCFKINLNSKKKKSDNKKVDVENIDRENEISEYANLNNSSSHSDIYEDYKKFKKVKIKEIENDEKKSSPIDKLKNFCGSLDADFFKTLHNLLKYVIKNFKFDDFSLYGTIGIDDPFLLGSLLGIISLFYSRFGDKMQIEPIFNKNILDIKLKVAGKVLLIYVLIFGLKVLINRKKLKLFFAKK